MAKGKAKSPDETPLMRQYNAVKAKYPDSILLFRVGDFYETFGEDAIRAARILGITLTKRGNGSASEIELAGFPYHALDTYLPRLVKGGQRVAVCDQLEDPKHAKGIVKRGVTEIVTPGIALNDKLLDQNQANYLACLFYIDDHTLGAAFADVSTGDFFCYSGAAAIMDKILHALRPAEVVIPRRDYKPFTERFGTEFYVFRFDDWAFEHTFAYDKLIQHFRTTSLKGFGLEDEVHGVTAAGVLLHYLAENEQKHLSHLTRLYRFDDGAHLTLDRFTLRNLELIHPIHPDGRTLVSTIDRTRTPMGARMLRQWIAFPLRDIDRINKRLSRVEALRSDPTRLHNLREILKTLGDLERLTVRVATRRVLPRECLHLLAALEAHTPLRQLLGNDPVLHDFVAGLRDMQLPLTHLRNTLATDANNTVGSGSVIRQGFHTELDELRSLRTDAQAHLDEMRRREAIRTGISSLKINYNRVFGYYIEISNAHKDHVPSDYIRRQTLTGAERYITPELKVFEEKMLGAEDRIAVLETTLYEQLINALQPHIEDLKHNARLLAGLDVLQSFAEISIEASYCRPVLTPEPLLDITEGRHPVIERLLPPESPFVPNDLKMNAATEQIFIITGPNMAGKSALLRQTALIVLMAQMGCYVPAKEATIGIADKIYTRVGASDNLSAGESTFLVEMNETAQIINSATTHSLVLLDEIGRGTSTYDGLSIAWALVEYLHNTSGCAPRTLFATHYHELAALAEILPRVRNYNVSVREAEGRILFLRRLVAGHSEHSFGIAVAEMAGLPRSLTARARALLAAFERQRVAGAELSEPTESPTANKPQKAPYVDVQTAVQQADTQALQLRLFDDASPGARKAAERLMGTDIERLTPVEALLLLVELRQMVEGSK